jgi:hemolysin D
MPESNDLIWIYVSSILLFIVLALAVDVVRHRARRRKAAETPPAMGSVGRALLNGGRETAPRDESDKLAVTAPPLLVDPGPAAKPADGAEVHRSTAAADTTPGWSMSRLLTTPSRVLRDAAKAPETVMAPNGTSAPAQKKLRIAEDKEFLPAALEILETPPSPVATTLMLGICTLFVVALLWSIIGKLDIHAVAQGKIQASGRTKVVQPLEPGRIAAIHVQSGQRVAAGDVLVELDPTDSTADLTALERELESMTAESLRRSAVVDAIRSQASKMPSIDFPASIGPRIRQRETDLMIAEVLQFRSAANSIKAQIAEKEATKQRLALSIDARRKVLGLSKERVGMREEIKTRGAGSRALIIEAELQYENFRTTDASERGQLMETDASIDALDKRLKQAEGQFIAEQTQKAAEADRRRDRLEQEIVKARSKRDRTQLRAPADGLVQQVEVTTLGQVVASGQSLMSVVPIDAPLEVEAMVANKDIGFVRPGQRAIVKVEAFPFSRYGSIEAEVVRISTDAVEDRNVTAMMDAASAARPQASGSSNAPPGQNLVFPAVVKLSRRVIDVDGKEVPLSPGMAVTVEIKTGERRAISYVLSPLREILSKSAHER